MGLSGRELFPKKKMELADGNTYTLEFNMYSLGELEAEAGGRFNDIFKLFGEKEEDFSIQSIQLLLWACLIENHEEFDGLEGKKMKKSMAKLISGSNLQEVIEATSDLFKAFWNKESEENKHKKK